MGLSQKTNGSNSGTRSRNQGIQKMRFQRNWKALRLAHPGLNLRMSKRSEQQKNNRIGNIFVALNNININISNKHSLPLSPFQL